MNALLTERRLRLALIGFFLALAIPAFLLAYRAYDQAQWEVFHRHRLQAEALSKHIDDLLVERVAREDARGFAEYAFFINGAGSGQRSALSAYPVEQTLPGLIGYFQVDSAGALTTPLLPSAQSSYSRFGIAKDEQAQRASLHEKLRRILSAPARTVAGRRDELGASAPPAASMKAAARQATPDSAASSNVFERLTRSPEYAGGQQIESDYGRVADLKLDAHLLHKSRADSPAVRAPEKKTAQRRSRKEQVAVLAEGAPHAASEAVEVAPGLVREAETTDALMAPPAAQPAAQPLAQKLAADDRGLEHASSARLRLFESELDPMMLQLLDDRHFVLFRNVWRDGSRYIQGALIERDALLNGLIASAWAASPLSSMSNLVVAWQGDVLMLELGTKAANSFRADTLSGELLYRTRLSAPLAALELIFSVTELPLAASATYLAWLTFAFVVILAGGCYSMLHFGQGQMRLFRQQQDFVSAVSHELKTPLTSIRMYSEILKAGWADEQRKATYYAFIHDESERLSRLIANILQLARMTRGQTSLELKPTSVIDLINLLTSKLESQLAQAGFTLNREIAADANIAMVMVDLDAMAQIVINIVDNAIKFSPEGARKCIDLSCTLDRNGGIKFALRDYGRGVAKGQMRRIFELFYRAENELTRDTVGTGIGLALVRQLAQAMGGKVEVRNRDPGAEFSLVLPRARAQVG